MSNYILFLASAFQAADAPFFRSPLLIIGIIVGILAAIFIFINAGGVAKGKLRKSFLLLGISVLSLVLGVLAVTLFPYFSGDQNANFLHDLSLVAGFTLLLWAADYFKKESLMAESVLSADKAKSDFITVVSHHFRTPLSRIRWRTDLLRETGSPSTAEIHEATTDIYNNVLYLTRTLDSVFATFAIDQGETHLNKKPILPW